MLLYMCRFESHSVSLFVISTAIIFDQVRARTASHAGEWSDVISFGELLLVNIIIVNLVPFPITERKDIQAPGCKRMLFLMSML